MAGSQPRLTKFTILECPCCERIISVDDPQADQCPECGKEMSRKRLDVYTSGQLNDKEFSSMTNLVGHLAPKINFNDRSDK